MAAGVERLLGRNYGLRALGYGYLARKMASVANPVVEITVCGGTCTITTTTSLRSSVVSFRLNEEFDEETTDGRKCKTIVTQDGPRLVQRQCCLDDSSKDSVAIREITDTGDTMILELQARGTVCRRVIPRKSHPPTARRLTHGDGDGSGENNTAIKRKPACTTTAAITCSSRVDHVVASRAHVGHLYGFILSAGKKLRQVGLKDLLIGRVRRTFLARTVFTCGTLVKRAELNPAAEPNMPERQI
ncbi:PREDICTED: uncharacterized protein LOC106821479 [Priapulus caudatus]|uniref:Uncharacterized protein LOC106821479 n=1 Tax=Priapulus caudatus TaxID=37621 RepID=A0ABM1FBG9_PRICU|nr:PREDICTED: uncharacterized protein LOC106821479 [Priapulus caudatus]